jgi:threonine synthase
VYPVEGSYDEAFDLCLQAAESRGWLNRNTAYHPLTLEGKKSAAFDLFIGFRGRLPDWIVVPVGDGVIIAGLHKGFGELAALGWIDRLPRLLAVQAAGSDALCRYLDTGRFDWRPAETAADSIAAGAPRALYLAARAVRESEGRAIRVSDEEILAAQALAASRLGRLVEPAAAASLAGLLRLQREGALNPKQRVLLLLTGNGLKDAASLARWIRPPEAHPAAEWRRLLGLEAD